MHLKLLFLCVCVWAFAISYSEAGIPKCCVSTKTYIPKHILQKVYRWDVQLSNGACDISAVILYVKGFRKPICAHPKILTILKRKKRSHHVEAY